MIDVHYVLVNYTSRPAWRPTIFGPFGAFVEADAFRARYMEEAQKHPSLVDAIQPVPIVVCGSVPTLVGIIGDLSGAMEAEA